MKNEIFEVGKKVIFNAGKFMPKALIGVSAGATVGAIGLAIQAGMEFQKLKDSGEEITWKDYGRIFGPCVVSGVFAIACAFAGLTKQEQRYAAAAALANLYESKEKDFEAKAREIFGDTEVNKVHDAVAKDRLDKAPEPMVAYSGTAHLDLLTGQYIYMDIETIRAKINSLNEHMNDGHCITKAEWCDTFDEISSTGDEELIWNNVLTGNIRPRFTYHTLASGRTVSAIEINEPRLASEESEYYDRVMNPGWAEV